MEKSLFLLFMSGAFSRNLLFSHFSFVRLSGTTVYQVRTVV
ncbi:hypothetical protein HMPREF9374_2206 [Desmospora sp. 8437]|nr:hypothetical protein HMPREF9374_2206 [Desmospora sp. 8437]